MAAVIRWLPFHPPVLVNVIYPADDSWWLDMIAKAQHGIWLGRDVSFTYGPLYQALLSVVPARGPAELGYALQERVVVPLAISIALVWGTTRLLLARRAAWERAFFFLLMALFWMAPDLKMLAPFFAGALFLFCTEKLGAERGAAIAAGGGSGLAVLACFLISADAGSYALLELAFISAAALIVSRGRRRHLIFAGAAIVTLLLGALAINLMMRGRALNFEFWRDAFAIVSAYRWSAALGLLRPALRSLLGALLISTAIFAWTLWRQRTEKAAPADILRLSLMFFLGGVFLESLVVRAAATRVWWDTFPLIFMAGAAAMGAALPAGASIRAAVLALLGLTAIFGHANPALFTVDLLTPRKLRAAGPECPTTMYRFQDACLLKGDALRFAGVTQYLESRTAKSDKLLIFPYENMYAFPAERQVAGAILQNYLVSGKALEDLQLHAYQQERPQYGIYSVDELASWRMDGIAALTRSPGVWLYLQRWYHREFNAENGIVILRRDDDRGRRWRMMKTPLLPGLSWRPRAGETKNLGTMQWPANADMLCIRIRAEYPRYWQLLKPASVQVQLHFADGATSTVRGLAQPNQDYQLWIYPWESFRLLQYFASDSPKWHERGAAVNSIAITFQPMDLFSVMPKSVTIEGADAVQLDLAETAAQLNLSK